MADPNTGDWSFRASDDEQLQAILDADFNEATFIDAYKSIIDTAMRNFGNKIVLTAVGDLPTRLVNSGHATSADYAIDTVLAHAFETYGDRLIIIKGALHAATPNPEELLSGSNPDLSVLKAWKPMWKNKAHTAGQFVWSFSTDSDYKMNGRVAYDPTEVPILLDKIMHIAQVYQMHWVEVWKADLLNSDYDALFAAIAQEFQAIIAPSGNG